MEKEIDGAGGRDDEFKERAAEKHDGVAEGTEEGMAGFVDHEIREINEEEIGGVGVGVEKEEEVGDEPGSDGEAGDGFPFAEVFVEPVHE